MASKEGNPGILRRVEPFAEKVGGAALVTLGLLSIPLPSAAFIAAGGFLYMFGRARTLHLR